MPQRMRVIAAGTVRMGEWRTSWSDRDWSYWSSVSTETDRLVKDSLMLMPYAMLAWAMRSNASDASRWAGRAGIQYRQAVPSSECRKGHTHPASVVDRNKGVR